MKVFQSSILASSFCKKGIALTIGNYDGIHCGHQEILKQLTKHAKRLKIPSVVYTFDPHPVRVLSPHVAPPLIQTLKQKKELLQKQNIGAVVLEKFNKKFASMGAVDFFKKILVARLHVRFIIVGYDFTFGARRGGDSETLEQLCFAHGVDLIISPAFFIKDTLVSSSLIRKHIADGLVEQANKLLGRTFFVDGLVIKGKGRGRTLGIPTANLKTDQELIPKTGVYATVTQIGSQNFKSVTNIGVAPSFGTNSLSIETHIIGKNKLLYRKKIRVHFVRRIRDEIKFSSKEALVKQIHADIQKAKRG